ncbi:ABC transporter substrate-binding protein, partial [Acinetobacter baumannii]
QGRKIKFIVEDTQYQVPRGVAAVNKLINRDKVFLIVGGLGTPIINAAFKDQEAANVPNLFPLTAARSMFLPLNKLKFYLGSSYYDQIRT